MSAPFSELLSSLRGQSVAVVGLGVSNLPLVRCLAENGIDCLCCDKHTPEELGETYTSLQALGVRFHLGEDYLKDIPCSVIFRTPGLHPRFLSAYTSQPGVTVTSEMETFFRVCPCRIIAVTGSDGKTTTTTLIAEMLRREGYTVHLGGNIGRPLLTDVPQMQKEDISVLELSSFQLHSMTCHPDIAVVTNVTPNHLDVHPTYEDYIEAKCQIFAHQTAADRLILNLDNEITRTFAQKAKSTIRWFSRRERVTEGFSCTDGVICRNGEPFMDPKEILIPGWHNVENAMAAFAAVDGLVSPDNCREVLRTFPGVEHRIELVRTRRGVRYYNDSIASSPTRTIAGLRSFDRKVILIAGGHDKHISFDPLAEEVIRSVKTLILTGETAEKIRDAVLAREDYNPDTLDVLVIDPFDAAVQKAAEIAVDGDIVTLSPACSSFDHFKNFAERGHRFRDLVLALPA